MNRLSLGMLFFSFVVVCALLRQKKTNELEMQQKNHVLKEENRLYEKKIDSLYSKNDKIRSELLELKSKQNQLKSTSKRFANNVSKAKDQLKREYESNYVFTTDSTVIRVLSEFNFTAEN